MDIVVVLDLVEQGFDILNLLFSEFDGLGGQALETGFRRRASRGLDGGAKQVWTFGD